MHGQQSPTERVTEIQAACVKPSWTAGSSMISGTATPRLPDSEAGRQNVRVAPLVLLHPRSGEPVKIVQSIEQFKLDSLPGKKTVFRGWQELHARLREVLNNPGSKRASPCSIRP